MQVTVRKMNDINKVQIYGAGIGPDIYANQLVRFTIDAQNVDNVKKIRSKLYRQSGTSMNVSLVDNGNRTLTASYIAPEVGLYEVVLII